MTNGRNANILITGVAGFIGSHLADRLLACGCTVTGIDNFDPFYSRDCKESNLAGARQCRRFRLVEGDIRDNRALESCAGQYDAIVHLAAKAGVRPSIAQPEAYYDVNLLGTQRMLEFTRRTGAAKMVFASSSSVYGTNPRVPWREDDTPLPISPYASTKISCELLGHVYSHLYGIKFLALRFFTVFGPRQRPDLAIRKFGECMLRDRPIALYGSGATSRDYTYIDDIVGGLCSAIAYEGSGYEVFNLGNNRPIALSRVVETLEQSLDRKARIQTTAAQPGDVTITCGDITKAGRLLGYAPRVEFEEGIRRFAGWLLDIHPLPAPTAPGTLRGRAEQAVLSAITVGH